MYEKVIISDNQSFAGLQNGFWNNFIAIDAYLS